jgi:hypothetical protein
MSRARIAALSIAFVLAASPAFADITAFLGANTTPSTRTAKGVAVGMGSIVGLELEYSVTGDDPANAAPELKTGMINGFIQAPIPLAGFQPYATVGGGFFRETLGLHEETGAAMNIGGGLKFTLTGPLQLRGDFRVFRLGNGALTTPVHRAYIGLNLKF